MNKFKKKKGQALLIVIIATIIVMTFTAILVTGIYNELVSKKSYEDRIKLKYIAQAGMEDTIFKLNKIINEVLNETNNDINNEKVLIKEKNVIISFDKAINIDKMTIMDGINEYGGTDIEIFDSNFNKISYIKALVNRDINNQYYVSDVELKKFYIKIKAYINKSGLKKGNYTLDVTIEFNIDTNSNPKKVVGYKVLNKE